MDDAADCVEHVWRLTGVTFAKGGAFEEYVCTRCDAEVLTQPWSWRAEQRKQV